MIPQFHHDFPPLVLRSSSRWRRRRGTVSLAPKCRYLKRSIDHTPTVWNLGGFKRGVWTRIAIAIETSPDPSQGKMQVWGELTGDPEAPLAPLTNMMMLKTAYDADEIGKFSVGPYQPMSLPAVSRDYANIQICDWVAP